MSAVRTAAPTITGAIWDDFVADLPVGVLLQDEQGEVLAANDRAAALLGMSRQDLVDGARPPGWSACDDSGAPLPEPSALAAQVLRTSSTLSLPMVVSRDGVHHTRVWADYHPVRSRGRHRLLVLLHPVDTDLPHSRGLLDPLTGLPNRALLLDRLDQALTRARTRGTLATLVLMDVHRLAALNAEHGFRRGDELLVALAGRLRQGLRADHTVARYGGDEFAVVAEHPTGTGEAIADRAREVAARPLRIGRNRILPALRVAWCTSDGAAPVLSVLTSAEARLRRPRRR
ncbi:diguanylate cyclase (GGDEF) domain-containing protein [Streptoalloteichus tenebrarius]|uniref:Diguanylate cyclase (GGDEF) domain-containing protein n=1 Tax=Streptoalloteichus tenebrarius (strain ATCC 17920 / DSM 40477 / JCM 4838 / CBS 697.72 / NBRC 16177 / NCIMB 11028 / NRRL B-12390 / A12253. 1 / ISP 5477) TaxID=1933 RepID=A0ABT1I0U2_STRSD|nr:diguanylate cyclase [Streptoalloteichus tenebrarius]MCP2261411.1 diguanylate cyclase (GGDEF) domain-containing protein [Streptoalloteichus tenebrarius]BFF02014.1 hypothetical protein GCM10020241_36890 [Streptoalloteichus tenebrarius]